MKQLVTAFFVLSGILASAQTIFHYGDDSVSVKDFLKAYHKNNAAVKTEKAFRDYLDLYIASRLKIREARERGYDTFPQMVADLENLRQQVLPSYLNDKQSMQKLVNEAFTRSQKDIHLAHIFISTQQSTPEQLTAAAQKLKEVESALKNVNPGAASFEAIAKKYSDDPSVKTNGGDLGWITVFVLPYELENLAYATPAGKISNSYQSKAGYHIFKNLGERKDLGRIQVAQILLAFPPGTDETAKKASKQLADSLYNRLLKGDDFGKLATTFSNDVLSSVANGQVQEFGVGQYNSSFENMAFSLPKNGAISKPFLTEHGYHIIKRLKRIAPLMNKSDAKAMKTLSDRVEQSDRIASTKNELAKKILNSSTYQKANFSETELWAYSDSILNYKPGSMPVQLNNETALFNIGKKTVKVSDWISYAQTFRYKPNGSGVKPYPQVWDEFAQSMAIDYYQAHLEDFNEDFRQQINEFKEGNLFFEIMQREVWGPAQTDTIALMEYYKANISKYNWKPSVDAVIFYATDLASAKIFSAELKKLPAIWQNLVTNFSEKISADSARFENGQIPNAGNAPLKPGTITTPVVNKADNTASFAYIIRNHDKGETRSFAEAKGLVINDYQNDLEQSWIAVLKKKYPVRVEKKVVDDLVKNKKY